MLKIKDGRVDISKSIALSKKQEFKMSRLDEKQRLEYALTLIGLRKDRVHSVNRAWDYRIDPLADKPKNAVLRSFNRLLENTSETYWAPRTTNKASEFIGVEIECLMPGDDTSSSCDTCDGSGRVECYNCEGTGSVTLTDSNDNNYRIDCAICDGDGHEDCGECDGEERTPEIYNTIRQKLRAAKITRCSVKSDGSLEADGYTGVEVTILLDIKEGFDKIRRACEVLNSLGAIVNSTCGLHVHLNRRNFDVGDSISLGKRYGLFLKCLSRLVPPSRRNNRFCKLAVSTLTGGRYYAVNMTALEAHQTIEIRLHSGTTDAKKIENWIRLLKAIEHLPADKVPGAQMRNMDNFFERLSLPTDLKEYFSQRFLKFNPSGSEPEDITLDINDNEDQGIETDQEIGA